MLENPHAKAGNVILRAEGLSRYYGVSGLLPGKSTPIKAVDGVDFEVVSGQTLAIVGESGSGKTTTARMVLGLETATSGRIVYPNSVSGGVKDVQAVFQDPYGSLNPRMRVGDIIAEPLGKTSDRVERAKKAIGLVGLDPAVSDRFPHMFSGGQRQRIAIARAIVNQPQMIVLDEPVSALDVSIRAQILNLLKDFQEKLGVAYLMITHDLATVRFISDVVAVMLRGRFVEIGPVANVLRSPGHPYTRSLVAAAKPWDKASDKVAQIDTLDLGATKSGCPLQNGCPLALEKCRSVIPQLTESNGRKVACHRAEEI